MSLKDKHIQQSSLSVMQMANDGDIPNKLGEGGHIEKEALVESRLWHVLLFHDPFSRLDWGDDRFRKGLSVFLVDESLDVLAIHVGCRWIILLVFVKDYSVMNGFYDCRRVFSNRVEISNRIKQLKRVGKLIILIREG